MSSEPSPALPLLAVGATLVFLFRRWAKARAEASTPETAARRRRSLVAARQKERRRERARSSGNVRARDKTASSRNHDDEKKRHPSRKSAQAEIARMKACGRYADVGTLNAYFNTELDAWFVGHSSF